MCNYPNIISCDQETCYNSRLNSRFFQILPSKTLKVIIEFAMEMSQVDFFSPPGNEQCWINLALWRKSSTRINVNRWKKRRYSTRRLSVIGTSIRIDDRRDTNSSSWRTDKKRKTTTSSSGDRLWRWSLDEMFVPLFFVKVKSLIELSKSSFRSFDWIKSIKVLTFAIFCFELSDWFVEKENWTKNDFSIFRDFSSTKDFNFVSFLVRIDSSEIFR